MEMTRKLNGGSHNRREEAECMTSDQTSLWLEVWDIQHLSIFGTRLSEGEVFDSLSLMLIQKGTTYKGWKLCGLALSNLDCIGRKEETFLSKRKVKGLTAASMEISRNLNGKDLDRSHALDRGLFQFGKMHGS
eukprot:TRINITY_DN19584_c0_g1_i1.p1 TRINITY_DN19584_c0_g1~~TRINITY_DN19584_c0_g1_i1.p1  ORF type:complete len:133 (-),score=31.53 TRINITY_DN19584_c0_g1_i1:89-487(-)